MTSRERVQAAFDKQATDKVPIFHSSVCSQVASGLLGREAYVGGGIQQWREAAALWESEEAHQEFLERSFQDAIDFALLTEQDVIRASYWRYNLKPTKRIDENTFLYAYGEEKDWQVLRYDPASEQCHIFPYLTQRKLTFDDLAQELDEREQALEDYQPSAESFEFDLRAQRLVGHDHVIEAGGLYTAIPYDGIWLEATALRPDLVGRLLDITVEHSRRNIEFLAAQGLRFFFGGGDFASNAGPMYSPKVFDELLLPRLQQLSEICHQHGAYHLFASDGNLWPVAQSLFGDSGVDGYYEIDRRAGMDLGKLREQFPELTLLGNISSHTVHLGSRDEIAGEVLSCIEEARRSHGIIVGLSNAFVPGTPIENAEVVVQTIAQNR